MSYGTIVRELARSLGKQIIAYDNMPEHAGCILHMDGPLKRMEIGIDAMDKRPSELAAFVRQVLAEPPPGQKCVRIGVREGELTLMVSAPLAEERRMPAEAGA
jgi:hypothetical protein